MGTSLLLFLVIRAAQNYTARTAHECVISQSPAASCLSTADCVNGGILSWSTNYCAWQKTNLHSAPSAGPGPL